MKCWENTALMLLLFEYQGYNTLLPHSHSLIRAYIQSATQIKHLLCIMSVLSQKQFGQLRGALLIIPVTSGYHGTDGLRQLSK